MSKVELASVTVNYTGDYDFPLFEQPGGYSFWVKEGEKGLSVGFIKVFVLEKKKASCNMSYSQTPPTVATQQSF